MDEIRTRLLAAALVDHDGLAAALTAAKDAEAWLQGLRIPSTATIDSAFWSEMYRPGWETVLVPLPAADVPIEAAPADPGISPEQNGCDTRSDAAAVAPPAPQADSPAGIGSVFAPSWLAETVAAARKVHAAGQLIQPSTMSRELEIASAAAGWRLAEMVKAGLATATGRSNQRRYALADTIPGIVDGPVVPVEEPVPAPEPAPAAEPASAEPETELETRSEKAELAEAAPEPEVGEAPAAAAPEPEVDFPSAPAAAVPTQDPPVTPADPDPAPIVPPPPATPRPRPPVLVARNVRPVTAPPPVIRPAAAMRTTMDDVVAFLRGRGLQVSDGPRGFVYQGLQMSAPELLKTANMIREGLRKPPLSVDGIASR